MPFGCFDISVNCCNDILPETLIDGCTLFSNSSSYAGSKSVLYRSSIFSYASLDFSAPLNSLAGYARIYLFRAICRRSACSCSLSARSAISAFFLLITDCPDCFFNNSHTSCSSSSLAIYPCSFSSSCCLLDSFSPKAAHTGWLALPALSALHRSQSGCPAPASLKPFPSLRVLCMPPPAKADHFFEFFLGFIYLASSAPALESFT